MSRCHIYQSIFLAKAKPLHLQYETHHKLAHLKQNGIQLKHKHTPGMSYYHIHI